MSSLHAYEWTRTKWKVETVLACHLFGPRGYSRCWQDRFYLVEGWTRHQKRGTWPVNDRLYIVRRNERSMKGKDLTVVVMLLPLN